MTRNAYLLFFKFRLKFVRWFQAGTILVGFGNDVEFRYFPPEDSA